MPPPGYEPFLRARSPNPEDDTVRLAYADWLDENGDPDRAEFIRVSIELSRTEHNSERETLLRKRVTEAVRLYGDRWLGEFPQAGIYWDEVYDHDGYSAGPFRRGFPVSVAIPRGPSCVEQAAKVFALAPIECLCLPRATVDHIRELLMRPFVGGITSFVIGSNTPRLPGDDLCKVLAELTHLRRLECLSLVGEGITDAGATALATAEFLPRLRDVWLNINPISEKGVLRIVDRLQPARIRVLYLPAGPLSEDTLQRLRERFGSHLYLY